MVKLSGKPYGLLLNQIKWEKCNDSFLVQNVLESYCSNDSWTVDLTIHGFKMEYGTVNITLGNPDNNKS
jgi:hypothetical protein